MWSSLRRAVEGDLNTLLVGPRGSGKTTLLRHLQMMLRDEGKPVVFVDATACRDLNDLALRVRAGVPAPENLEAALPQATSATNEANAAIPSADIHATLEEIGRAPRQRIIVDASASGAALFELFGRFRDPLWQQNHRWLVAADTADLPLVTRPPADAFFESIIRLEPMTDVELERLLALRSPDSPGPLIESIVAEAEGQPRRAVSALIGSVVGDVDPNAAAAERNSLIERAGTLGRPYAMLMTELLDRGQASPSDEALQRSLGISRARLTDNLRKLMEAGLVTASAERRDTPGRPRTLYQPAVYS